MPRRPLKKTTKNMQKTSAGNAKGKTGAKGTAPAAAAKSGKSMKLKEKLNEVARKAAAAKGTAAKAPKASAANGSKTTAAKASKAAAAKAPKATAKKAAKATAAKATAAKTPKATAVKAPKVTAAKTSKATATKAPKATSAKAPKETAAKAPKATSAKTPKETAAKAPKALAAKPAPAPLHEAKTPNAAKSEASGATQLKSVATLSVGDAAPAFSLASSQGGTVALKDFRGAKNVVLYFYPKDDTPGCTIQACSFRDAHAAYGDQDTVVLGVSADDLKAHGKFTSKFNLSFPLLADTTTATAQAYGVWVEKNMYGNKKMGIQRTTFLIAKDGKIAKVWPKVAVEGHSDEVLLAVKALSGGGETPTSRRNPR